MPPTMKKNIRLDLTMENRCLVCGGEAELKENKPYEYICTKCHISYYRPHCWHCKDTLDSRDTEIPRCSECGWLRCTCSACKRSCVKGPFIIFSPYEWTMSDEELNFYEEERLKQAQEDELRQQFEEKDLEQMRKEYPLDEDEFY